MRPVDAFMACLLMLAAETDARAGERQVSKFLHDHAPPATVLVCAGTVAPADCNARSAVETLVGLAAPGRIDCGVQSEELLVGSGVATRGGQYVKVACAEDAAQSD